MITRHIQQIAHQEDVFEREPIDDPIGDPGQPVPGSELPEAEELGQVELDAVCVARHDRR